jgi:polysaccharide pyruvyl transferase WcaK-like protein
MRKVRVCVFGAVGHNIGDEAIAVASIEELARRIPEARFVLATRRPRETARATGLATFMGGRRGLVSAWRELGRSSHLLIGGGTLIQDDLYRGTPWRGTMPSAVIAAEIARWRGIPAASIGIGVERLRMRTSRVLARRLTSSLDPLIVRDAASANELKAIGASNANLHVAADPAVLLAEEEPNPVVKGALRMPYMAISVLRENLRPSDYRQAVIEACRAALAEGRRLVFVPMDDRPDDDLAEIDAIVSALGPASSESVALSPATSAKQVAWVLRRAEVTLAMRLHAMILSLGRGTYVIGISRGLKTDTFLRRHSDSPVFSARSGVEPTSLAVELARVFIESTEEREQRAARQGRMVEEDRLSARAAFDLLEHWLRHATRR